ncbi:MAG: alpha-galactosidase, partial [Chitinophagaceae bacterium]|nr:alpha-galactosidase [Chitinophagaceae bacterium]
ADGRDWDGILHVDATKTQRGLMMLYNPLPVAITRTIKVPLYYTGLTDQVRIREKEGVPKLMRLDRNYEISLTVQLPASGYTWFGLEKP